MMNNNENFVAINLIEENNKSLFSYPIVYYWDGKSDLIESLHDLQFISYIKEKITTHNYYNTKIFLIYTFINDNNEILYHQDNFLIKDIYDLQTFNLDKEYLWEILNFLYKCAYKKDYENKYDIKNLYLSLLNKYPKKINEIVVSNFIQSKLKENYNEMNNKDIMNIIKKFFDEIEYET